MYYRTSNSRNPTKFYQNYRAASTATPSPNADNPADTPVCKSQLTAIFNNPRPEGPEAEWEPHTNWRRPGTDRTWRWTRAGSRIGAGSRARARGRVGGRTRVRARRRARIRRSAGAGAVAGSACSERLGKLTLVVGVVDVDRCLALRHATWLLARAGEHAAGVAVVGAHHHRPGTALFIVNKVLPGGAFTLFPVSRLQFGRAYVRRQM